MVDSILVYAILFGIFAFNAYIYLLNLYDDVVHGWRLAPLQRLVLRIVGRERLVRWIGGGN